MSRPPVQGKDAVERDVATLVRILRRAGNDTKRPLQDRQTIERNLKSVITILLNGSRIEQKARAS